MAGILILSDKGSCGGGPGLDGGERLRRQVRPVPEASAPGIFYGDFAVFWPFFYGDFVVFRLIFYRDFV